MCYKFELCLIFVNSLIVTVTSFLVNFSLLVVDKDLYKIFLATFSQRFYKSILQICSFSQTLIMF